VNQTHLTAYADSRTLAASLGPLVAQACGGRLGEITWFKTDWQRGGAATGKTTFQLDDGTVAPVVLKMPVVGRELLWTRRLQSGLLALGSQASPQDSSTGNGLKPESPIPRLFASGESVGGYDLAWIVIERFAYGPLGLHWHNDHVMRIADAAAQFHADAATFAVDQPPKVEDWPELLHDASENIKVNHIGHEQRWSSALRNFRGRLGRVLQEWDARNVNQWLHGDLHLANAMSRVSMESGPVCLIDLAEVHAGHWVEDAVYLERQLWARPERLKINKPVKAIAAARKERGLAVDSDWPRLAMIRRALLAATAPKFIKSEGHPVYLDACLSWLEIALTELR
jgi:hypothetical protein